jgi:hypothetical protein
MTTPRGNPELVEGQAIPETTVNEQIRGVEAGASHYSIVDRVTAPPGSPADGDVYLIIAAATGAFAGKEGQLAIRFSTSWIYRLPIEGRLGYVLDEDKFYLCTVSHATNPTWAEANASASEIWTGTATNKFITPAVLFAAAAPVALTSSASITPDFNAGFNFTLTLAHSGQLENPTNQKAGQSGTFEITQDGTGSRTLSYGTNWKFPGGAPVLSTAAGAIDVLAYIVQASGRITATLTKAYAS